jgi:hypothetical protein
MILEAHLGSRFCSIPDPEVKKELDSGSGSATLLASIVSLGANVFFS